MRGRKPSDDAQVEAGLAAYVDIETAPLPSQVEEKFGPMEVADLVRLQQLGDIVEEMAHIQRGFVWILIKRKLQHGNFKKFVEEHGRKYMTVWNWMCRARAYQRCGAVAKYIPQRALQHLLMLTDERAYQIAELCIGVPAAEAKKVTSEAIEVEYRKIQAEKKSGKPPKPRDLDIAPPSEFDKLVPPLLTAMRLIAEFNIPEAEHAKAKRLALELEHDIDRLRYNLFDPAHSRPPIWESPPSAADIESLDDPE